MPVPEKVIERVETYTKNRTDYRQQSYKEAQMRIDFINPFFAALGWDMENDDGLPEAYRQVVHEDALKIERTVKAPDYSFRLGGQRKFFLETKKVADNINIHKEPAYQLRRYAWTANLPVSLLSSFEEMAVYDGRIAPSKDDSPKKARLEFYKYTDYLDKWDEIHARFSREAVESGAFDRYAEDEIKMFRGRQRVDAAFLQIIEGWRSSLAQALTLKNPSLSPRDLNRVVQTLIDRILFLRICEARGVEAEFKLQPAANGANVYPRLLQLFRHADDRYNSGLFHLKKEPGREEPDTLTPSLTVDDRPLKAIIASLYYPESPFEFSVMPADILGQVYEQFLGKVIRVDAGTAVVEEKPEVRKAGGVFYTPTYIVDYIVRQTVGRLVDGKTPKQVEKVSVLDPACGSGSFLIGAYQFLLDWHVQWYVKDGPQKHAHGKSAVLYEGKGGAWQLTTAERKRILRSCIYGVDIDRQATEVTKLSLLLKMLEGESAEVVDSNLKLFKERALPDLDDNIKCGNSLIGTDFYADQDLALFDTDTKLRINTFDWAEGFPNIMEKGGFSAVIGNPPYIRIQTMREYAPPEVDFFGSHYTTAERGNYDIYVIFVERGLKLLAAQGQLGFILPHKFFNADYGKNLRVLLAGGQNLSQIVDFGDKQVFSNATTYTCLLFLSKAKQGAFQYTKVSDIADWQQHGEVLTGTLPAVPRSSAAWNFAVDKGADLSDRLSAMPVKLTKLAARMAQGIRTSANEVYVLTVVADNGDTITARSDSLGKDVTLEKNAVTPFLQGRGIRRYALSSPGRVVLIPYRVKRGKTKRLTERAIAKKFPLTYAYLLENKTTLEQRERGRMHGPNWYAYVYPKNADVMKMSKILVPDITDRAAFALDACGQYAFTSGYGITLKTSTAESQLYILALLNSKLLNFYLHRISTPLRGGFFRTFTQFIGRLPIRAINFDTPADKKQHDALVSLVERMLSLHTQLPTQTDPAERTQSARLLAATDKQIDAAVYALYGLTQAEIDLVEGRQASQDQ